MPRYMVQGSYGTESISSMVKNPSDRAAALRGMVKGWGGKLESFYFSFGDYDVVVIAEVPDNVTMAAVAMAVGASGALKSFKTTILLTAEEAVDAMRKASSLNYRAPGG